MPGFSPPLFAGLGLAAALAAPAFAASDPKTDGFDPNATLAKAFGNTIVSTYPDGRKAELWLKADGSYSGRGRSGDPSSGKWNVSGRKLCLQQSSPVPAPFRFCTPIPHDGMGRSWTAKAVTGEQISVSLIKGGAPVDGD
jgi:hypothetical protein